MLAVANKYLESVSERLDAITYLLDKQDSVNPADLFFCKLLTLRLTVQIEELQNKLIGKTPSVSLIKRLSNWLTRNA